MSSEAIFVKDRFNALAARLLDEDEDVRFEAANEMLRMGEPVLLHALQWTNDPRPRMRAMACYLLGQIGRWEPATNLREIFYRDGIPIILQILSDDPEEEVRADAACALGHLAEPSTIPTIIQAALDISADVRFYVAMSLGCFTEGTWDEESLSYKPEVGAALLRLMEDEDEDVRDWGTFGIHQGGHDTPETRAALWKALDDPNPDVRGEAAEGLAKFGDRSLIPRLDVLLREDEDLSPCYFMAAETL